MSRQISITVLRGVKASLFLLAVIGVSSFLSLSHSRPAQAESLLYGLTCTVSGLLGNRCVPKTEPAPSPPPPPSGGTNTGTTKPGAGGSSGAGKSAEARPSTQANQNIASPGPIELGKGLLEEMPGVATAQPINRDYSYPAHIAPTAFSGDNSGVLGQAASSPIEASQEGWKILGLSWIWWLSAAILTLGVVYATRRAWAFRRFSRVAKF